MEARELQPGSFRKVPFLIGSTTTEGGRKLAQKRFINSDDQLLEDLGKQQRRFSISGFISAQTTSEGVVKSYKQVRDELLDALELGGTGILVHPFYQEIPNVVAISWNISESINSLGLSSVQMTFGISNTTGIPVETERVLDKVKSDAQRAITAMGQNISINYSVSAQFAKNFEDGINKVNELIEDVNNATEVASRSADQLDDFSRQLTTMGANVTTLVDNPTQLSDSTLALFDSINGLYPTVTGTFDAFVRLFEFGELDIPFQLTTVGRVERQKNRDVLNASAQGLALSYAYSNAAQREFQTVDEIDEVSSVVEDQYQKLTSENLLPSESQETLTQLRLSVTQFFDAQREIRPRIITVRTNFTTPRLLAYQYYGSSSLGPVIADLNGIQGTFAVQGELKVITA